MGGVIIKLIICGNGLDIHVGLNTSYRAYRDYLVNKKIYEGESAISIIENPIFLFLEIKIAGRIWKMHLHLIIENILLNT